MHVRINSYCGRANLRTRSTLAHLLYLLCQFLGRSILVARGGVRDRYKYGDGGKHNDMCGSAGLASDPLTNSDASDSERARGLAQNIGPLWVVYATRQGTGRNPWRTPQTVPLPCTFLPVAPERRPTIKCLREVMESELLPNWRDVAPCHVVIALRLRL